MKPRNFWWNPAPRPVVLETILRLLEQGPWHEHHLETAVWAATGASRAEFSNALEELETYQEKIVYRYEEQKFYLRPARVEKEKKNV